MNTTNELNLLIQSPPKMKKSSFLFTALLPIVLLLSCSAPKKESAEEQMHLMSAGDEVLEEPTAPQYEASGIFRQQLNGIFSAYVALKESLVASDLKSVKAAGKKLSETLNSADKTQLSGASLLDWTNFSDSMAGELKKLDTVSELEAARLLFPGLTEAMYKIIKAYGLDGVTAYYAYCPMAFNNKGGYWLSDSRKIRNPYFGDAMLECGGLREQLR